MSAIWLIIPAHGRYQLTRICLKQIADVVTELELGGFDAGAIVIADDRNADTARDLGLEVLRRPNKPLGKKWNDGYELACHFGADYVCPLGSDDWIDPVMFGDLPADGEIRACRESAVVREDGRKLARLKIPYPGGDGVRIIPRDLLERVQFRPADNHRDRAIDTSIMDRFTRANSGAPPRIRYSDASPFQIVDWKSSESQLNTYRACLQFLDGEELDPWEALRDRYPFELLEEMAAHYGLPALVEEAA